VTVHAGVMRELERAVMQCMWPSPLSADAPELYFGLSTTSDNAIRSLSTTLAMQQLCVETTQHAPQVPPMSLPLRTASTNKQTNICCFSDNSLPLMECRC
jgi:hypothetical protein